MNAIIWEIEPGLVRIGDAEVAGPHLSMGDRFQMDTRAKRGVRPQRRQVPHVA